MAIGFNYTWERAPGSPFPAPHRLAPLAQVADRHVPVATFFVLLVVYAIVTFEKIDRCVAANMVGCR